MLSQYHEVPAAGCVSSQNPIFDRALIRTRPARNQLCARISILQFRLQRRCNFHRERMIVKAEIRTSISADVLERTYPFLETTFHAPVPYDQAGNSGPPWERPAASRWNWVLIDKANQKLRQKLKSSRWAFSSGRLCADVDRSAEILHRKSTRHDPSICRATRLHDRPRF